MDGASAEMTEDDLWELFQEVDADGSGYVDQQEIAMMAKRLGAPLTKRELAEAMNEMDEDGSGEVDFEEFKVWWAGQKEKKSKWAAALNDRWSGALKRIQEKQREEKDLNEAQKALEAVAKSHGKLTSKVNQTDEQNRKLKRCAIAIVAFASLPSKNWPSEYDVPCFLQTVLLRSSTTRFESKKRIWRRRR